MINSLSSKKEMRDENVERSFGVLMVDCVVVRYLDLVLEKIFSHWSILNRKMVLPDYSFEKDHSHCSVNTIDTENRKISQQADKVISGMEVKMQKDVDYLETIKEVELIRNDSWDMEGRFEGDTQFSGLGVGGEWFYHSFK